MGNQCTQNLCKKQDMYNHNFMNFDDYINDIFQNKTKEKVQKINKQLFSQFTNVKIGTSGFRDNANNLYHIALRVGMFMGLLSKKNPQFKRGIMITASHNPPQDNGFKLSNEKGHPIEMEYELILQQFANYEQLTKALEILKNKLGTQDAYQVKSQVLIGGDTRKSTTTLKKLIQLGLFYTNSTQIDMGITTTPQFFFYGNKVQSVNHINLNKIQLQNIDNYKIIYCQYFLDQFKKSFQFNEINQIKKIKRIVDCANGVGGQTFQQFLKQMPFDNIKLINKGKPQHLNQNCGSEHVQKLEQPPYQFLNQNKPQHQNESQQLTAQIILQYKNGVSFDGDADRIILFVNTLKDQKPSIKVIDGDKLAVLYCKFLKRLIVQISQQLLLLSITKLYNPNQFKLGVVQTCYANGASTEYLKYQEQVQHRFSATGVKHLHKKAEQFDIGIYFETNGHGNILLSELAKQKIKQYYEKVKKLKEKHNHLSQLIEKLCSFLNLSNPVKIFNKSTGDAIINFLLIEVACHYLNKSYEDLFQFYKNYHSKTTKVQVKNKHIIKLTQIENQIIQPVSLQKEIDTIVTKHQGKRAFVRPSGTQNCLRVYVEADQAQRVQIITKQIQNLLKNHKQLN